MGIVEEKIQEGAQPMSTSKPEYTSWEEYVDRDERDLVVEGVLQDSPDGVSVDGHAIDDLLRPWTGKNLRVSRQVLADRLILTVVEVEAQG